MTFLGKILVVLHLVLSVMFMAFAGAVFTAQKNWKTRSEDVAKQLATAQQKTRDTETQLADIQSQKAQKEAELTNQITQLSGENTSLKTENQSLDAENKQLMTVVDSTRTLSVLTSDESNERVLESQSQRARNAELRSSRDAEVAKVRDLQDQVFSLNLKLQQTNQRYEGLLRDNATMRSYLASKGLPTDPKQMIVNTIPAEPVDAIVLDVRPGQRGSPELVAISVGTDDGLAVGHRLTLFRDAKYLGQVEIVEVTPKTAVASVIADLKAKNAVIKKGDNATTKF